MVRDLRIVRTLSLYLYAVVTITEFIYFLSVVNEVRITVPVVYIHLWLVHVHTLYLKLLSIRNYLPRTIVYSRYYEPLCETAYWAPITTNLHKSTTPPTVLSRCDLPRCHDNFIPILFADPSRSFTFHSFTLVPFKSSSSRRLA